MLSYCPPPSGGIYVHYVVSSKASKVELKLSEKRNTLTTSDNNIHTNEKLETSCRCGAPVPRTKLFSQNFSFWLRGPCDKYFVYTILAETQVLSGVKAVNMYRAWFDLCCIRYTGRKSILVGVKKKQPSGYLRQWQIVRSRGAAPRVKPSARALVRSTRLCVYGCRKMM